MLLKQLRHQLLRLMWITWRTALRKTSLFESVLLISRLQLMKKFKMLSFYFCQEYIATNWSSQQSRHRLLSNSLEGITFNKTIRRDKYLGYPVAGQVALWDSSMFYSTSNRFSASCKVRCCFAIHYISYALTHAFSMPICIYIVSKTISVVKKKLRVGWGLEQTFRLKGANFFFRKP